MPKPTPQTLFLSFGMFIACIVTGTLITLKLTDSDSAMSYFFFTSIVSIFAFSLLLKKYKSGQINLSDQLLYFCFYGFCLVWFFLSLFFPIFWMKDISLTKKIIIAFFSIIILTSNFLVGFNEAKEKWHRFGITVFEKEYEKYRQAIAWEKVAEKMKINISIYVPGVPKNLMNLVSILMIGFMILGLNLRTAMPTFSVFAWGIPATVFAGCLIQLMGTYFFLIKLVYRLEKDKSFNIRAGGE
jgi:hypothetical protein